MIRLIFVISMLLPSVAFAQQQPSPSQTAIQIDNVVNQWAQQLDNDQRAIAALQKQIDDLKAKYEPDEKK